MKPDEDLDEKIVPIEPDEINVGSIGHLGKLELITDEDLDKFLSMLKEKAQRQHDRIEGGYLGAQEYKQLGYSHVFLDESNFVHGTFPFKGSTETI